MDLRSFLSLLFKTMSLQADSYVFIVKKKELFANGDSVLLLKIPAYKHESRRQEYLNPPLGISEVVSYLGNMLVRSGKEPLPHCVDLLCVKALESQGAAAERELQTLQGEKSETIPNVQRSP